MFMFTWPEDNRGGLLFRLVGAVWCVVAAGAALLPLRSGEMHEKQEEEGNGNHVL